MFQNRILFILHLPPPIHGAAMVGQYIKESKLVQDTFTGKYINLSTSKQVDEIGKSSLFKLFTFFRLYLKVISALIRNRFDLCYITINSKGTGFYKELIIVAIVKFFRVPIVYHYHNKGVTDCKESFINRMLHRFQLNKSRTILLSPLLYNDIEHFISKDRVYYCPNGVPLISSEEVKPITSKPIVNLLFLSNMMESKGVYTLLESCKILKERGVIFKANFIGSWGDITPAEFNSFIKTNGLESVSTYLGVKYGDEKKTCFEDADIFVFPTYYDKECFPLVLLEAMQYKLPIVTTNEGAIPEIVEDGVTGFIVPKRDALALANKIEYLINNPEIAQQMGAKGYEKYMNSYTLEIFEKNFVSTINQVLADFKKERS